MLKRWKATQTGNLKPDHRRIAEGEVFEFDFDVPAEDGGYAHLVNPNAKKGDKDFGERVTRLPSWVREAKPERHEREMADPGGVYDRQTPRLPSPPRNVVGKKHEPEAVRAARERAATSKAVAKASREAKGVPTASGPASQAAALQRAAKTGEG